MLLADLCRRGSCHVPSAPKLRIATILAIRVPQGLRAAETVNSALAHG
jgi:hypothetical protein